MTGQHDSAAEAAPQGNSAEHSFRWRRLWPLAAIALLALVFFALDFDRFLDLEHLRQHRLRIEVFVADHFALAAIAFVILYVIVVVLSLPAASLLTMCAGFMFGWIAGAALAVCGATIGATLLYLAAKTSIGDYLRQRAGPWMRRAERGLPIIAGATCSCSPGARRAVLCRQSGAGVSGRATYVVTTFSASCGRHHLRRSVGPEARQAMRRDWSQLLTRR
jgi:hypothetical protein